MINLSVIVPIFKAEPFIERCCRSLFGQTLEDMEFIFVDDASPDDSMAIVKKVAAEYPNRAGQIKYLSHTPNREFLFLGSKDWMPLLANMWSIVIAMTG